MSEYDELLNLGCEQRYEAFLQMVADERDIWILISDDQQFLVNHSEDDDSEYLPVWPSEAFAHDYANTLDEKLTPKSIAVPEFFAKWVAGLQSDGLEVSVFPTTEDERWIISAAELKDDLQEAMSAFF